MKGDKKMKKGISAVIATILLLVITISMAGLAYVYISGIFARTTEVVSLVDALCINGNARFFVINEGTATIDSTTLRMITVDASCTGSWTLVDLPPHQTREINITGCASGQQHSWRLITPAGGLQLSVYCP